MLIENAWRLFQNEELGAEPSPGGSGVEAPAATESVALGAPEPEMRAPEPHLGVKSDRHEEFKALLEQRKSGEETPNATTDPKAVVDSRSRDDRGRYVPAAVSQDATPHADWITQDVQQRAAAYGIPIEDVQAIGDAATFEKSLVLLDRAEKANEERRLQWQQDQQQRRQQQESQQQAYAQEQAAQGLTRGPTLEEQIKALEDQGYGPEVTAPMKALANQNREVIQQVRRQEQYLAGMANERRQSEQNACLGAVDDMKMPDLFGTDTKHTPDQRKNAQAVVSEYEELRQRGMPANEETVRKALNRAMGDKIAQRAERSKSVALKQQSNQRMGSSTSAVSGRDGTPTNNGKRVFSQSVQSFWDQAQRENGRM